MTQEAEKTPKMETVQLKNGSVEAKPLVTALMMSLQALFEKPPIAFYESVMKCRDNEHECFGNTADVLKGISLIQSDGEVHDSLRNIVLSAVEGNKLDIKLDSPIPETS